MHHLLVCIRGRCKSGILDMTYVCGHSNLVLRGCLGVVLEAARMQMQRKRFLRGGRVVDLVARKRYIFASNVFQILTIQIKDLRNLKFSKLSKSTESFEKILDLVQMFVTVEVQIWEHRIAAHASSW